ncbi:hypothetical protein N183_02525 [Sinorhizobium sp. Sb3]|nr:hypothetical protein N183_02525 [Sinorhizobium sp. Sb3]
MGIRTCASTDSAARLIRRAKVAVDFDLLQVFVLKSRSIEGDMQ